MPMAATLRAAEVTSLWLHRYRKQIPGHGPLLPDAAIFVHCQDLPGHLFLGASQEPVNLDPPSVPRNLVRPTWHLKKFRRGTRPPGRRIGAEPMCQTWPWAQKPRLFARESPASKKWSLGPAPAAAYAMTCGLRVRPTVWPPTVTFHPGPGLATAFGRPFSTGVHFRNATRAG